LHKIVALAVCLLILAAGCKKEAEPEKPRVIGPAPITVPAGMALLEVAGKGPVFIRTKPVTVGEYCEFLHAVGWPVPERYTVEGVILAQPVEDLTLNQAVRYATWRLARLPDAEEWRHASHVVGHAPYPWGDELDADTPREGTLLYLVQDYLPGSDGEAAAEDRKTQLLQEILATHADDIAKLQSQLKEHLAQREQEWQETWQQYKVAFFSYLDDYRKSVNLETKRRLRQKVRDVLGDVAREKMKQIQLLASEAEPEEMARAAEDYRAFLGRQREAVRSTREEREESAKTLQQKTIDLKQQFEALAEKQVAALLAQARQTLAEITGPPSDIAEAVKAKGELDAALQSLVKGDEAVAKVALQQANLAEKLTALKKKIEELSKPTEIDEAIAELQKSLVKLSKHLEKEFVQEQMLFKELDELSEKSARAESLEAEVQELEAAVRRAAGDTGTEEAE